MHACLCYGKKINATLLLSYGLRWVGIYFSFQVSTFYTSDGLVTDFSLRFLRNIYFLDSNCENHFSRVICLYQFKLVIDFGMVKLDNRTAWFKIIKVLVQKNKNRTRRTSRSSLIQVCGGQTCKGLKCPGKMKFSGGIHSYSSWTSCLRVLHIHPL